MSVDANALVVPAAFIITKEVAAYINLGYAESMGELPEELIDLTRKEQVKAVLDNPDTDEYDGLDDIAFAVEVLEEYGMSVGSATEAQDEDVADVGCSEEFTGSVTLTTNLNAPDNGADEEFLEDDCIAWVAMDRAPSLTHAAYSGIEEMVEEIRKKLAPTGLFPDDFDYKAYMGTISGVESA